MATKSGRIVTILIKWGKLAPRHKRFVHNRKGLKLKGIVRRGSP